LAVLVTRGQDALHAGERQRERPLAQDVHPGGQGRSRVNLVQMVGRADHHHVDVGVAQHFFNVVVGILHVEARRQRLRFADVVVADCRDLDPRQPAQHRQVRDLRDRSRPEDADANRIVHLRPVLPATGSRPPGKRYMIPVRTLAVFRPLDSTPRPSSVKRQAFERLNSKPIVPFNPAVMTSSASSTNVPLIAGPLPFRTWMLTPVPMYALIPCPCGNTYW